MKKREVIKTINSMACLPSNIDELISEIQKIKNDAEKDGYEDITVEFDTEYGYYDDSWTSMIVEGCKKITVKEFVESKKQCICSKNLKTNK